MTPTLSTCGQEVYAHDRDRFLQSLFVPAAQREVLLTLYALNVELSRVRDMVSEEMIGHIRYAWWYEAVEEIYATGKARGQPVLQALASMMGDGRLPQSLLMPLIEGYREHFPGAPPDLDGRLENMTAALLRSLCPEAETRWRKAVGIIRKHRMRHGMRRKGWLSFKLLLAGL